MYSVASSPSPWVVARYLLGKLDADPGHCSFLSRFFCCYIKRKSSLLGVRLDFWEGGARCPQASKEHCLLSRVQWRHCYFHFPKSNPYILYTHTPFPLAGRERPGLFWIYLPPGNPAYRGGPQPWGMNNDSPELFHGDPLVPVSVPRISHGHLM